MTVLERDFQAHLFSALNAPGRQTRVWRQNAGRFCVGVDRDRWIVGAPKGAADLVGFVRPEGWHLEIECKGAATPLTTAQRQWSELIRTGGGIAVLVRYDVTKNLKQNVARALGTIDRAIADRRGATYAEASLQP